MECTQRLECTQELYYGSQNQRSYPEQIGFLGICGKKYPVKKGPNKIGRDPQTCNIILNLSSVSRQHAVINILNEKDFMLMDLDSANKTKILGQTLQPYIPHPLHNGDTVQFGEIFGIFRLLEVEDDLPMTQAIDIPDTPLPKKHMSRVNAVTTIPESPDVSDRDDSFIVPSQPKEQQFQNNKAHNFIKPGKTISIQPVGNNKIDNVYWNSSKKSTSLSLDDSDMNDSIPPVKLDGKENEATNNVHELETREMFPAQKALSNSTDSIYTANTQIPELDNAAIIHSANTQLPDATSSPSIHSLNTQIPCGTNPSIHILDTQLPSEFGSPSIHTLDTQIPCDYLPEVCKIIEQQDMQFEVCANKDINDIHNAETQIFPPEKENVPIISNNINDSPSNFKTNHKISTSNDEILFDDVDNQSLEERLESQAILTEDIDLPINELINPETESQSQIIKPKSAKRNMRIKSDSSTDCEDIDILPTQKILENKGDDDVTDCEEDMLEAKSDKNEKSISNYKAENFEDMLTQVIVPDEVPSKNNKDIDFEDMPTQVLDIDVIEKDAIIEKDNSNADLYFEDLPTQILDEDVPLKRHNTHLPNGDEITPFKVPFTSPLKAKKKDVSKASKIKSVSVVSKTIPSNANDDIFYQNTQDLYHDLCTQKIDSPEVKPIDEVSFNNTEKDKSCYKLQLNTSINSVDAEEKVNDFVSNLSSQEVRDMIGVDSEIALVTKVPSDGSTASDVEVTPKKLRPYKFMDIDLPNSQEIKTSVTLSTRSLITESSSESETEHNSEDQCTPILFRKKKKTKPDAKLDLTKKFDVEALPSRVITRVRKPTAKLQDQENKKTAEHILKPTFLTEQECEIDEDIITENISRLKSKNEKSKNAKYNNDSKIETKEVNTVEESVIKDRNCRNDLENVEKEKLGKNAAKVKDENKDDKRKKREQKESILSKIQNSTTVINAKQVLDSTAESKDKTTSLNVVKDHIADSVKKDRICIKKDEYGKESLEINPEKIKDEKRNKREPKNTQKEIIGSKNQSTIIIAKQSIYSTVILKDKAHSSNKCQEIETGQVVKQEEMKVANVETGRNYRKKTEDEKVKLDKNHEQTKDSSKDEKKTKREPKDTLKESSDSKNPSSIIIRGTKQPFDSTSDSKDETHSSNKSKEIKTFDLTGSPVKTRRNTRNTRNAKIKDKTTKNEKKSASPERDSQTEKPTKRKYTKKQEPKPQNRIEVGRKPSPEKEIRRSKRQRTVKENKEEPVKVEPVKPKSILKKCLTVPHEESTVYNLSSGSNSDSSRTLKRPALDDSEVPSPKRTRSVVTNNTSLRATPARMAKTQYVLFTAFPFEAVKIKLEKMGAVVVTDVMKCTVILTQQIKRTFKLLCAVGLGKPIVGPNWVQACADTNMIVDPWLYLIKDEAAEKRFHFNLERTLTGKRHFLRGYNVSSTPKVMPQAHEMRLIVECSGGTWQEGGPQWICVSVPDDIALWPSLQNRGATIVSTEFILGGVLRQKVEIEANKYK